MNQVSPSVVRRGTMRASAAAVRSALGALRVGRKTGDLTFLRVRPERATALTTLADGLVVAATFSCVSNAPGTFVVSKPEVRAISAAEGELEFQFGCDDNRARVRVRAGERTLVDYWKADPRLGARAGGPRAEWTQREMPAAVLSHVLRRAQAFQETGRWHDPAYDVVRICPGADANSIRGLAGDAHSLITVEVGDIPGVELQIATQHLETTISFLAGSESVGVAWSAHGYALRDSDGRTLAWRTVAAPPSFRGQLAETGFRMRFVRADLLAAIDALLERHRDIWSKTILTFRRDNADLVLSDPVGRTQQTARATRAEMPWPVATIAARLEDVRRLCEGSVDEVELHVVPEGPYLQTTEHYRISDRGRRVAASRAGRFDVHVYRGGREMSSRHVTRPVGECTLELLSSFATFRRGSEADAGKLETRVARDAVALLAALGAWLRAQGQHDPAMHQALERVSVAVDPEPFPEDPPPEDPRPAVQVAVELLASTIDIPRISQSAMLQRVIAAEVLCAIGFTYDGLWGVDFDVGTLPGILPFDLWAVASGASPDIDLATCDRLARHVPAPELPPVPVATPSLSWEIAAAWMRARGRSPTAQELEEDERSRKERCDEAEKFRRELEESLG